MLHIDVAEQQDKRLQQFADEVSIIKESRDANIVGFRGAWLSSVGVI